MYTNYTTHLPLRHGAPLAHQAVLDQPGGLEQHVVNLGGLQDVPGRRVESFNKSIIWPLRAWDIISMVTAMWGVRSGKG